MARLAIVVEVSEDPRLIDPYTVAENIVDAYNEMASANGDNLVEFVVSAWGTPDLSQQGGG